MAADNTINVKLNVSSNGTTAKETKLAEGLHQSLERAAQSASKVRTGGGTAGSRAVAAASEPVGAQLQQRNIQRGVAEQTGASARDFANQAQGLGGLVRLYATLAANVFAVGAAFRALSSAMDTTNMIKGLDQLGASSGRNLGSISKRVTELSEGALSLRESMQVVASASSAGMSTKDIERLTVVAKNASIALGRSMPDAAERLTRGIVKLEPELLDELGIMTRIEPAIQAYAREVGKAATQLTDLERRQAFANAVLKEGEEKFSAIAGIAVNPYNQLLATLKNVIQSGLEVVNKVLTPVVSLLSSSPTALAVAIGAIGTALVKQAIPALGQFKAGLAAKTEQAQSVAQTKVNDALKARELLTNNLLMGSERLADAELERLDKLDKIARAKQEFAGKELLINKLLKKDIQDLTEKDFKRLEIQALRFERQGKLKEAEFYRETAGALRSSQILETEILDIRKKAGDQVQKDINSRLTMIGINKRLADAAEKDVFKKQIVSSAAYNASLIGVADAWKMAKLQIDAGGKALSDAEKAALKARVGFAVLGGVIGTLGAVLNAALGWIGLIITALGLLDSFLSKSGKESANFSKSIDSLGDSVANVNLTLETLNKKGAIGTATIGGIFALSNAMQDLRDTTEQAITSATKLRASMGWWDRLKDNIAGRFGGGLENNLAESLTKSIEKSLKIAQASGQGAEFQKTIQGILKVESLDTTSITKSIANLSDTAKLALVTALSELNNKLKESNSSLQGYKTATEDTTRAYQEFIQSTANTDPLFKLGASLEKLGQTMQNVLTKGPRELAAAMIDLAKSPEKGVLFGSTFITQLVAVREKFLDSQEAAEKYKNSLQEVNARIEAQQKLVDERSKDSNSTRRSIFDAKKDLENLKAERRSVEQAQIRAIDKFGPPEQNIKEVTKIFTDGMNTAFKKGAELIDQALGQASQKASLTIQKAALAGLTGEARARAETTLALQDIKLKEEGIKTSINLILAQERLTAAINESNALADEARLSKEGSGATAQDKERAAAIVEATKAFSQLLGKEGAGVPRLDEKNLPKTSSELADTILKSLIIPIKQRLAAQQASLIQIGGERTAAKVAGEIGAAGGRAEDEQKKAAAEAAINETLRARANILASLVGLSSQDLITSQASLDVEQLKKKQKQELISLDKDVQTAQIALNTLANGLTKEQANQNLKNAEGLRYLALKRQQQELFNLNLETEVKLSQVRLDQSNKQFEVDKARSEVQNVIIQAQLDIAGAQLDALAATSSASQTNLINQRFALDLRKQEIDFIIQAGKLQTEFANKQVQDQIKIDAIKKAAAASGLSEAEQQKLISPILLEQERQRELVEAGIQGLRVQSDARKTILEIQKESNLQQEKYNELLNGASFIANQLGTVFGDLGKNIGVAAQAMADFAVNSEKGANAVKAAEDRLKKAREDAEGRIDPKEEARLQQDIAKKRAKNSAQELSDMAKIAGATKGFFKEKTLGFKVLQKTEQALHLASIAMKIKEMLLDKTSLASKLANNAKEMASTAGAAVVDGVKAVINAMKSLPPPLNFAAGAAMAAVVASVLGQIGKSFSGGGGGGGGAAPSAQQRQETQGSAMGYDEQGRLSQFTRGKLGDPTAKSTLLEDSMQLLTEVNIDNLDVNNKQLEALRKIEAGIRGVVSGIYNIPGLSTGSLFGTQEGSKGFNFLGGLLGSSRTREIIDSGLRFSGSLQDLANDAGKLTQAFETVRTTTQRSFLFFRSGSTRDSTETKDLSALGSQGRRLGVVLSKTFDGAIDFLRETAKAAGYGEEIAGALTEDLPEQLRTFSARGLKPEEMGQAFQSWLGGVIDYYGVKIFEDKFDEFTQGGEELTQTVARVVRQNEIVNQSFKNLGFEDLTSRIKKLPENIGKSAVDITVEVGRVSQQLIDLAGGLDKFTERSNFIAQNFLTDSQRRAIAQESLTRQVTELGIDPKTIKTRQDYLAVQNAINDSVARNIPGAAELSDRWENLAYLFDQTLPALDETIASLQEIPNKIAGIKVEVEKLQRPGYEAGNAFWQLVDGLEAQYQALQDSDQLTRENVDSIIQLTQAQLELLIAQNKRKSEESILAFEIEASTGKLTGFAATVANIGKKAADLVKALVSAGTVTPESIKRITAAARKLYDEEQKANQLAANEILIGVRAQAASLGLSQLGKELQNITNSIINTAKQLANLGQLTDEAINTLISSAETQANFAREQSQKQSQNILTSFAKETENLGLTQFAQQIQGIRDKARGAIEQLAQLGQATEENIAYIVSLAEQQAEFARLQNQRQAQDLVIAKSTEIITKNLGDFGQELLGIAQQAEDTVRQLVELGQATDENIAAVRAWQDAMVQAARITKLAAQEQQYAQVFSGSAVEGLAAKFRSLGFTLPGNIQQFKALVDAIDTTSIAGIDLRGKLLDLGSEFTSLIEQTSSALRSAYDARVQELTGARDQFKQFSDTLKEFKKSLLTGNLSPLTPQQQYQVNRQEFLRISGLAQTGDVKAIEQLESASSSFLESSRAMFASSDMYAQDFDLVTGALDNTTTVAERQVEIADNTLSEIKNVVGALIDLSDDNAASNVVLTGVGADLQKALADYTQLTNSVNIDLSRFEATSANQRNALLEASNFVQNKIDSGISSVASTARDIDSTIGDVASGITNMDTGDSGNIAALRSNLETIKNEQNKQDFSVIETAIEEALTDEENPTNAALTRLNRLFEDYGLTQYGADGTILNNRHTNITDLLAAGNGLLWNVANNTNRTADAAESTASDAAAAAQPAIVYYDFGGNPGLGAGGDFGGGFAAVAAGLSGSGFDQGGEAFGFGSGVASGDTGNDNAKGGVYGPMGRIEMFARGGMVDSPTLFKFARGTGLMGEAGPEAIMPLRRDRDGNLGVISQNNSNNLELKEEITKLNQQIKMLTEIVAQGAVMNVEATDRNTEAITTTISDTKSNLQYMKKIQNRTTIV